jgi:hypothetical protein
LAEQPYNSDGGGQNAKDKSLASQEVPHKGVARDCDNTRVNTFGLWGSAEHLLWWIKNDRVPPGGRFTLCYDFESAPIMGIEASYFFLPDGGTEASFSSNSNPVLGRPYIDVKTVPNTDCCWLQTITSFHKYSEQIDLRAHRRIADRTISQLICR